MYGSEGRGCWRQHLLTRPVGEKAARPVWRLTMTMVEEVRGNFEGFGAPCSSADLERAEQELGHQLPAILRELYVAFDGFSGPAAASFFYPLLKGDDPDAASLVGLNLFLRGEDYFPAFLHEAVIFGSNGCGSYWGLRLDSPGDVFEWHPEDGEAYMIVGGSPLDAWLRGKSLYAKSGSEG
jgi:hypothetical protein